MTSSIPPSALRSPVVWTPRRRRIARGLLLVLLSASLVTVALFAKRYFEHVEGRRGEALAQERAKARIVKTRIDSALRHLPLYAHRLAAALSEGDLRGDSRKDATWIESALSRAIRQEFASALAASHGSRVDLFQFGLGLDRNLHPTERLFLHYVRRKLEGGRGCESLNDPFRVKSCEEISSEYCVCTEHLGRSRHDGSDATTCDENDYTCDDAPKYQWFHQAKDGKSDWVEPYFDTFTQAILTEFSTPFESEGRFWGSVYANYSSREMSKLVTQEDLGGAGYASIVSAAGTIVVHPVNDYVRGREKLEAVDPQLWRLVQPALAGDPVCGEEYTPLGSNKEEEATATVIAFPLGKGRAAADGTSHHPLALIVVFDADRGINLDDERRTMIVLIDASLLAMIALILLLLLRSETPSLSSLWTVSVVVALAQFAGVCAIWALTELHDSVPVSERPPLVSKGRVARELESACSAHEAVGGREVPHQCRIPTGLFVQSVRFTDADTVALTGYVWQKYPVAIAGSKVAPSRQDVNDSSHTDACTFDTLRRGFLLPEAIEFDKELAYEKLDGDTLTLGWTFRAALRKTFVYSRYPFDTKDVEIRMWHEDFSRDVVLVPDLEAYTDLRPQQRPGVEKALVTTGWKVRHSFFRYAYGSFNTNFGIVDYAGQACFPELHYHVVLQRTFFSAFVKNLVPLLVAAIILFSVLLLVTRERSLANRYGANTAGTMAACSGLFFTVLLAHIQLRSDFPVDGVLYLEWFNFAMYVMILGAAMNAYLYSWDRPLRWVAFRDNLIAKLLFWPTLLLLLLVATTTSFYP